MKFISIEASLLTLCLLNLSQAYDLKALAEYYNPGSGNDATITAATTTTSAEAVTSTSLDSKIQAPIASVTTIVNTVPTTMPIATDAQLITTTITPQTYVTPAPNPTTTQKIEPTTAAPPNNYYEVPKVGTDIPHVPIPIEHAKSDSQHNGSQESAGNHQSGKYPGDRFRHHPQVGTHDPPTYNTNTNQAQDNYQPANTFDNPQFNWQALKAGFQNFITDFRQEYSAYQNSLNTQQYSVPTYNNNNFNYYQPNNSGYF